MWVLLSLAILSELTGTMSLRASDGLRKKPWLLAIVPGYVLSFVFLSFALSNGLPLGIAYGVWVACGVALTAVSARILFNDPLTPRMAIGILLIATGVLLVELGMAAH